jgi:hypothetical protein
MLFFFFAWLYLHAAPLCANGLSRDAGLQRTLHSIRLIGVGSDAEIIPVPTGFDVLVPRFHFGVALVRAAAVHFTTRMSDIDV